MKQASDNFFERSGEQFRKITYSIAILFSVTIMAIGVLLSTTTSALSISASRDCDDNAVIKCGALTINELKQKYQSTHGAPTMFNHMGISSEAVQSLNNTNTVEGKVTRAGRVVVGEKTVATGAKTVGRQNISGSTAVTRNGITFYERTPEISFQAGSLKAFVVSDKDGKFLFAVIASCGNPVKATPVAPPKPPAPEKPTPTPPPSPTPPPTPEPPKTPEAPTPPPVAPPEPATVQKQQQQQSAVSNSESNATATVTVNNNQTPPPPPAPQQTVVEKPVYQPTPATQSVASEATKELPKTGMQSVGSTVSLAGLVALMASIIHYMYTRKKYT